MPGRPKLPKWARLRDACRAFWTGSTLARSGRLTNAGDGAAANGDSPIGSDGGGAERATSRSDHPGRGISPLVLENGERWIAISPVPFNTSAAARQIDSTERANLDSCRPFPALLLRCPDSLTAKSASGLSGFSEHNASFSRRIILTPCMFQRSIVAP